MEKQKRMIGDRRSQLTPGNQHGGDIVGCAGVIRWWRRLRRSGMNAGSERRRRGEMEEERERFEGEESSISAGRQKRRYRNTQQNKLYFA